MYSVIVAYFLWVISGFGALGFHRFYLNKIGTGIIWFLTGGLFMVGSIFDLLTLPAQVAQANSRLKYGQQHVHNYYYQKNPGSRGPDVRNVGGSRLRQNESIAPLEKHILLIAKNNNGVVTPGKVALEADESLEKAREELEKLASKGFLEMRIKKTGMVAYVMNDFYSGDGSEFEDI